MNSSTLRQLWSVIEENHTSVLLSLGDGDLVKQLLNQLNRKNPLSKEEASKVSAYLYSKTSLIRDLAYARSA
jgi:hypothetical protein